MHNTIRKSVTLIILVAMLLSVFGVSNVFADSEVRKGRYLESLIGASSSDNGDDGAYARELIDKRDYSLLDNDLNGDTGCDWLYLGYKYTEDYSKAIKSIIIVETDEEPKKTIKQNDIEYKVVPGVIGTIYFENNQRAKYEHKDVDMFNFNQATKATSVYLYTTTDSKAGVGLGAITMSNTSLMHEWDPVYSETGETIDINKKGSATYLHTQEGTRPDSEPMQKKYLYNLYGASHTSSGEKAREMITSKGYELLDKDLNADTGADYLYLGYKYTDNLSKAIKDIIIVESTIDKFRRIKEPEKIITHNGMKYILTSGSECNPAADSAEKKVSAFNFNNGTSAKSIYIYTTTDFRAGEPICAISASYKDTDEKGNMVCSIEGGIYNINESGDTLYLHIKKGDATVKNTQKETKPESEYKQKRYLNSLYGASHPASGEYAKNIIKDEGYELLDTDLNADTGGDWLYLGYSYTEDYKDAIKDIIIVEDKSYYPGDKKIDTVITYNDIEYTITAGTVCTPSIGMYRTGMGEKVDKFNFNHGTSGTKIYIYTTKDARAGKPIYEISATPEASEEGWDTVCLDDGNVYDINNSGDSLYLHTKMITEFDMDTNVGSTFSEGSVLAIIIGSVLIVGLGVATYIIQKKKKSIVK